ncbi:hypothetical protein FRC01_010995 [Tulasnella sp. 417]|nr:hypothetical protein FRC01_010995 [Tulasnella sp. 417]
MSLQSVIKRFYGRPISVLWDHPNSPAAKGAVAPMAAKIRKSLRPIGPVADFIAYVPPLDQAGDLKSYKELLQAGIKVNECRERRDGGDPVDDAIILKLDAIGSSSEKAFVALISGDGDFAKAIGRVHAAGHGVGLVLAPNIQCSYDLLLFADAVLLGKDFRLLPTRSCSNSKKL